MEKEMASHSSILAWRIPWTEEPGGVQSIGLQRVRHDCAANTCTLGFPGSTSGKEPTRQRRRHKTQVRSLSQEDPLKKGMASHSSILVWRMSWTEESGGLQFTGDKELDTTERLSTQHVFLLTSEYCEDKFRWRMCLKPWKNETFWVLLKWKKFYVQEREISKE